LKILLSCGFAAAPGGEPPAHWLASFILDRVEAELRRINKKGIGTVSRKLTAMCGSRAANQFLESMNVTQSIYIASKRSFDASIKGTSSR
jgi:hypothetical protein